MRVVVGRLLVPAIEVNAEPEVRHARRAGREEPLPLCALAFDVVGEVIAGVEPVLRLEGLSTIESAMPPTPLPRMS